MRTRKTDRSSGRGNRPGLALLAVAGLLITMQGAPQSAVAAPDRVPGLDASVAKPTDLAGLPLYFVANQGQVDRSVDLYLQGSETSVYFNERGLTYQLSDGEARDRWSVKLDFVGANRVEPIGRRQTAATINVFKGAKEDWRTGIRTYSQVVYENLWDDIDLVYSGTGQELKYSFFVRPGGDPADIRLAYRGASDVVLTPSGEIEVSTPVAGFTDASPRSFQGPKGARSRVSSSYILSPESGRPTFGFELGAYDRSTTLVIDPAVIIYAGFIGGSGAERGLGIDVDDDGAAYITGVVVSTESTFPETVGPDQSHNGDMDAFVAKVAPGGATLQYAGYIGGDEFDLGRGIAVDDLGAAYVTGETYSAPPSFPALSGPDLTYGGGGDAFVTKVSPAGDDLVYSGYVGGTGRDQGWAMAVDSSGASYMTGNTNSDASTLPATVGPDLIQNGADDAFVAKVAPDGGSIEYAGYIGGDNTDQGRSIAVDEVGAAYVSGNTASSEATFPEEGGADLTFNGGFNDAFVAKIEPGGAALDYAGYIGGAQGDEGLGIAVGDSGAAYVVGYTESDEQTFPVVGSLDPTFNGGNSDAYVVKVSAAGSSLSYAGYIGGVGDEDATGIAMDGTGAAVLTGFTESSETSFPVLRGPDLTHNGAADAYVAKVADGGTGLLFAGYIGGAGTDAGSGVAVDRFQNAYVAGYTTSGEGSFPVSGGPDETYNGDFDAFVAKVSADPARPRCDDGLDNDGDGSFDLDDPGCTSATDTGESNIPVPEECAAAAGDDNLIVGTDGNDVLTGTDARDVICGGKGADTIKGLKGGDFILGGDGADDIEGNEGNDDIEGGDGADFILGKDGQDSIEGSVGADELEGGDGEDLVLGQDGQDSIEGNVGADELEGNSGDDTIYGKDGADTIQGGPDEDVLKGDAGKDDLTGGSGDDELFGGLDSDSCSGGDGRDTLTSCES